MVMAAQRGPAPDLSGPEATRLQAATRLGLRWAEILQIAEKDRRSFAEEGRRVVERYLKAAGTTKSKKRGTPILYANTEQLRSALYAKPARPDVRRRFAERDPVGQQVAEMVERALIYFDDTGTSDAAVADAVFDLVLPGRGVVRIEYEPIIGQKPATDPMTGAPLFVVGDDGQPTEEVATVDFIADQKVRHHYVYWTDFLCSPARRWADVSWVAFRHVMSREAVEDEIYEAAPEGSELYGSPGEVPLDWKPEAQDKNREDPSLNKAEVWEIWDKPSMKRLWIVKGSPWPLRVDADPYELEGFWPCPEPMSAYGSTDTVIPQALFRAYEDEADDLDELTRRISNLTKALKRRGIYDASVPELARLANANDNQFIPAKNYAGLAAKGGLEASMQTEDISQLAAVILNLMKQRDAQVQAIYEISGISDIMRGSTDPDETFGAQQLKAQTGSMRLRRMQAGVARFWRDLYRITVDLLCRHFDPQVLGMITNMQVTPDIMAVLQSDAMRGYRVDVETDSTVFQDAAQEQTARAQLLNGVTQLITAMAPIVAQKPEMATLMFKMLEFGVAPARDARMLEDAFDQAQQALAAAPQMQPGQMNPEMQAKAQAAQAQAQTAQTKAAAEAQKGQTAVAVAQIGAQAEMGKAQAETQRLQLQLQQDREAHAQGLAQQDQQHQQALMLAQQRHELAMQSQAMRAQPAPGMPGQAPGPSMGTPRSAVTPAGAPMPGAQLAPDGHHYVALPHAHGQFHRVTPHA